MEIYASAIKRVTDLLILVIFSPLWIPLALVLSLIVKLTSKGPVLFKQTRVGKGCSRFVIYKFRSMYVDTPKDTPTHLLGNPEAYITPLGKFMRKLSLDELPQILNVFRGDIALVGPRPALWNQDDLIAERAKYGANDITPGLTGLAQVRGRDELPIAVKASYDGEYRAKMSFLFDMRILLLTVRAVFRSEGVVEGGTGTMESANDEVDS